MDNNYREQARINKGEQRLPSCGLMIDASEGIKNVYLSAVVPFHRDLMKLRTCLRGIRAAATHLPAGALLCETIVVADGAPEDPSGVAATHGAMVVAIDRSTWSGDRPQPRRSGRVGGRPCVRRQRRGHRREFACARCQQIRQRSGPHRAVRCVRRGSNRAGIHFAGEEPRSLLYSSAVSGGGTDILGWYRRGPRRCVRVTRGLR